MNYIIEDSINFYDELNNTDDEEENCCLISGLPLTKNKVVLECGHEFNFQPIYNEVINQKIKNKHTHYSNDRLLYHQIKCPYCRNIQNKLLPHVKINKSMNYISGVNSPEKFCMKYHCCKYKLISGKNKGNICGKLGYFNTDITNEMYDDSYCMTHHNVINKKLSSINNNIITNSITDLCKCSAILKSGKRKGGLCNAKVFQDGTYCKRHTSQILSQNLAK